MRNIRYLRCVCLNRQVSQMASEWRNPKYDIKAQSRSVFKQALCLSLGLVTLLFLTSHTPVIDEYSGSGDIEIIQIEDIPNTDQLRLPPAPSRPMIPIPTVSEDIPEDVTIMDTTPDLERPVLQVTGLPGTRGAPNGGPGSSRVHTVWEQPPELVRMVTPTYPPEAHRRNIEGQVVLTIVVDERGHVVDVSVVQSTPSEIFDAAAVEAIMLWRFKPAKFRNQPIKVRINQTVTFSLGRLY